MALVIALGLTGCGDPQLEQALADALAQTATDLAPTAAVTAAGHSPTPTISATVARSAARATRTPKSNTARPTPTQVPETLDGLRVVGMEQLPPEARETLALIERGGPYPYRQDGAVFQNREGLLPQRPRGYYHEYTVETPRSSDRGARRIVTGEGDEIYYTADHYESFVRVLMP